MPRTISLSPMQALIGAVINAAGARLRGAITPMPMAQFAGQHTNPKKNAHRAAKRAIGARQVRKNLKAQRRADEVEALKAQRRAGVGA